MSRTSSAIFACAIVAASATSAVAAGDPAAGEALAQDHCAKCHDVSAGGPFKNHPPSFASIAVYRPEDQIRARILFPGMHSGMPDIGFSMLDQEKVDDIVAYILSLETH